MILETGRSKPAICSLPKHLIVQVKKGFTLVELVCVVAIISMLFGLSIPALSKTARNFYFTSKVKQIEYLLIYLKKTAALENRKYKLIINLYENSYAAAARSSEADYAEYTAARDSLLSKKKLSSGLKFKTPNDYQQTIEIIFEPRGSISAQEFFIYDLNQHKAKFETTLSGQISMEIS